MLRPCPVCLRIPHGPVVRCDNCHNDCHPQCIVAVFHQTFCEGCYEQLRAAEEARRLEAASRGLGLATARGSEVLGHGMGAVGAAAMAALQFLERGVHTGATHACAVRFWAASMRVC